MKKELKIYIIAAFLILHSAFCIAQNWEWVKLMQPASNVSGLSIILGPNGKVYGYGGYQGSMAFNNGVNLSGNAGFICMFDTAGQCQWAQKIVAGNGCGCSSGGVSPKIYGFDSGGNLIVAGMYCGCGADFGNGITTSDIANTMFLAKFNTSGQCQWVKTKASTSNDNVFDVTMDNQDNIYVSVANYANGVSFGGLNYPSQGGYLSKFSTAGNGMWNKKTLSGVNGYAHWFMEYNGNKIYSQSGLFGTTMVGTTSYTAQGYNDIFIAVCDTGGNVLRSSLINGQGSESPYGIVVSNNKILTCANTNSTSITAGTYTLNTDNSHDKTFLIAYDTSLNVLNARNTCGDSTGGGGTLISDKFGNIYVFAYNTHTTTFGNLTSVPAGRHIFKMDASLQNSWYLQSVGGTYAGLPDNPIAPDTLGNVYIIDGFTNSANYGSLTETSSGYAFTLGKIQNALTGGARLSHNTNNNNMAVYPNPGDGLFNLNINAGIKNKKGISISLFDANGKQVDNITYTQTDEYTLQVDLSSYAKGIYSVKVLADGVYYSAKLER